MATYGGYTNNSDDDDDDDSSAWARKQTTSARTSPASTANSLRTQLTNIADQFERTKLNEQGILNRRINTITAEKRALVTAKSKVEEELEEEKAKVEAKEKELEELRDKVETLEMNKQSFAKRTLATHLIMSELVSNWPSVPVYELPPDDSDGSETEGDSTESEDERRPYKELEPGSNTAGGNGGLGDGSDESDSDSDEDDDDVYDEAAAAEAAEAEGGESAKKKKKKKKRG
eukprot:CAMPEP_0172603760 /NCGR_PEP_ID=MMETSP1068-20121228/24024_1 /TAXON_ID=35684 /ORGANISM="Pseudopedinella elastica, Strain CCMP716" /LENGTH=231 /DNA_ID=CAMNT_0013405625 /DNA_START=50 /DNA_END=741 /DNA_ORIENTATION=-